jgi:quinol monooxygenase YgiN
MSDPIVYIDRSEILDGKLEELKKAIDELVAFVERHEPQLVSYGFFIDEQAARMTLVAVHPDSASLEFHMDIAASMARPLGHRCRGGLHRFPRASTPNLWTGFASPRNQSPRLS